MKNFESRWRRLADLARQAPDTRDVAAPFGFSTRVAARAFAAERPTVAAVFERLSVRALLLACLLMVTAVAANYPAANGAEEEVQDQLVLDPVGELLAMS